jgi:hypothetical protein
MTAPSDDPSPPRPRESITKRLRLPRLSGKASAFWLVCCFGLTAILIPAVLGLPRWVEVEVVLATWWVGWVGVLGWLLYTGHRVTDDHKMHEPRNWFRGVQRLPSEETAGCLEALAWFGVGTDGEGCLIVLALILAVGLVWFLVEIGVPVVLFLLYFVARGMLAQAVNDRHHCRGDRPRAVGWAFVWATVYTAPLAGAVWFVHHVHATQAGR